MEPIEPIEQYLDGLQRRLRGSPREVRRMLCEAESHLYDAVTAGVRDGLSQEQATAAAIERFGSAHEVGSAHDSQRRSSWWRFGAGLAGQFAPLVAVGLLAIGLSGLVARLMIAVWSPTTVFGDAPGTQYPASACHHWLSIHPKAGSCPAAYVAESMADGLQARYGVGLLGLALAVALVVLWRRRVRLPAVVPSVVPAFAGLVAFGVAGLGLLVLGVDRTRIADGHGSGQFFSAAVVAVPIAAYYLVRFVIAARRDGPPSTHQLGMAMAPGSSQANRP